MLRALWFIAKIAALVFAISYVLDYPGQVRAVWLGYEIETTVGFLGAVFLTVLLVWTLIYRLWRAVVDTPALLRRLRLQKQREEGYRTVTRGLVAIAAGDVRLAQKYTQRAQNLIPQAPLVRLLGAQTALLGGDSVLARKEFIALTEDKDAAFLGVRGLLSESLAQRDYRAALEHIRAADKLAPKRPWVVKTLFDLETRNAQWERAHKTLTRAEKTGALTTTRAKALRCALFMAQSDEAKARFDDKEALRFAAKAFDVDAGFVPAALRLCKQSIETGRRRRAMKYLQKSFALAPHPELGALWKSLAPKAGKTASIYEEGQGVYDWVARLCALRPEHSESLKLKGRTAMDARLWKQAREDLMHAQDYRGLAALERTETGNEAAARSWMEKAADAPPPPAWVCAACGHEETQWHGLCARCGAFAQMEWVTPHAVLPVAAPQIPLQGDVIGGPAFSSAN